MKEFTALTAKTYSYLLHDNKQTLKSKGYKKVCHEKKTEILKFLKETKLNNKSNQL